MSPGSLVNIGVNPAVNPDHSWGSKTTWMVPRSPKLSNAFKVFRSMPLDRAACRWAAVVGGMDADSAPEELALPDDSPESLELQPNTKNTVSNPDRKYICM